MGGNWLGNWKLGCKDLHIQCREHHHPLYHPLVKVEFPKVIERTHVSMLFSVLFSCFGKASLSRLKILLWWNVTTYDQQLTNGDISRKIFILQIFRYLEQSSNWYRSLQYFDTVLHALSCRYFNPEEDVSIRPKINP